MTVWEGEEVRVVEVGHHFESEGQSLIRWVGEEGVHLLDCPSEI